MAELVGCGRFFHGFTALPHGGRHSRGKMGEPKYYGLVPYLIAPRGNCLLFLRLTYFRAKG
jgi:hypothetical protein